MTDKTDITTDITVYHNPKCGTSRSVLALLEEHGVEHETVLYMDDKLSHDDFDSILDMLTDPPTMLIRRDPRFKELGISEGEVQTRAQVLRMLDNHPELMQRPIVVTGGKACISRPAEKAAEFLGL